ncbi:MULTISPECIES: glycoside hydrolase family 25 protein [Niastella]|uniref:Glycoside hydrolase family 25 protein n=1 Tax=Niastella soli TaxID=2821487 RepID=A0ABS3YVZ6_9BACT|nr:glycoside hydrolase family 25 protein [Niastella soli]MBO9202101.1 glycoside hydrolase family 25 protein [Niastella soli]
MKKNLDVVTRLRAALPVSPPALVPTIAGHFKDLLNVPGKPADFIRGIDISHHNNITDWTAIKKADVQFVYIKISEGVGTPDKMAKTNALAAQKNGLKIGYYHFGRPDKKNDDTIELDATAEASEVKILLTELPAADLPLMLDLEDTASFDSTLAPKEYLQWVETFLSFFFNADTPSTNPLIYSRKEYLDRKLPPDHTLGARYKLWLSRYTADQSNAKPANGWDKWDIWQFTEKGVLGNNGNLDLNLKRAAD